ncbi:UDP-N-acetylmuramate dehydrogenase [Pokkaliibacter sp. MBI-7]|uniref:UDP-N-acetylmuramate dehydrogenase n=1 Tax=Pokkaliibacter sp. MBI-7 TaxID=3040600 RepID=UPI002446E703|nr:UDP-N-acetylmuramate dehydrogenase [Pokkaliibacter sp. MBI-7]MDH2434946.1 UDP-N-acetylmuramate dehydrogenase [Pokkaliibacter sp. MBI-7]
MSDYPEHWQENADLLRLNTFGFSVEAEYLSVVHSASQLQQDIAVAQKRNLAWRVLGGGSNVVLCQNLPGLTLLIDIKGVEVLSENESDVTLNVGAGENWHSLVCFSLSQGWSGLENLALIPGTVGAAPVQNIGAYGMELKDVLLRVQYLDTVTGAFCTREAADCNFSYRHSIFKESIGKSWIIVSVELCLSKQADAQIKYKALRDYFDQKGIERPTVQQVAEAVVAIRQSKLPDPDVLGNAGSFFKNPWITAEQFDLLRHDYPGLVGFVDGPGYKLAAAWLIDQLGFKGWREGAVGVHKDQALVLVHHGGGNGEQLLALAQRIQLAVKQRYGVLLEQEPVVLQ